MVTSYTYSVCIVSFRGAQLSNAETLIKMPPNLKLLKDGTPAFIQRKCKWRSKLPKQHLYQWLRNKNERTENKIKEKAFNRALEIAKEVQKVSGKDTNILQLELFMIAIALAGIGLVGIPEIQKEKILSSLIGSVKEATDFWKRYAKK